MKKINLLMLLLSLSTLILFTESCSKEESCPTTNCNTGTLNEATCTCTCPNGFSGANCQTEDLCITQNLTCENGGTCVNGACDCPEGYMGTNCEEIDLTKPQALLDAGKTPKELFDAGVTVADLYGKTYEGGLIFYLNTTDGSGMVAAAEDEDEVDTGVKWGCTGTDISNLSNVGVIGFTGDEPGARVGDGKANTDAILADCSSNGAARLCRDKGADWFLPSLKELELMYLNLHKNGHGGLAEDWFNEGWYYSSTEEGSDHAWYFDFERNNDNMSLNFKDTKCHIRAVKTF